ncbi:hypothetical protein [Specibacter sp. NPDC078709]|uniref:hypothetical protein n=1 Tax=Specibacter sp. NPDC078709 TaxID=3154364 RepID=UPI00341B346A
MARARHQQPVVDSVIDYRGDAMDYDTVELLVGVVLALVPVAVLVVAGLWCLKAPTKRMPWFFFLGPVASVISAGPPDHWH